MSNLEQAALEFLALPRIAVAGVSRDSRQTANFIYRTLRTRGSRIFAVNPNASEVEGDPSFPDLASVPGGVDGVILVTPPRAAAEVVRQCRDLGIRHVWMHRALGPGSVSADAVAFCRENGISVIAGACPIMYSRPVDMAHRCFRAVLGLFGQLPRPD
jgi:uncharacterized protein